MEITAVYYLIPALIMFCCGVYGFITRKNMIAMLISLELMLNAVDINFVVFNRFLYPEQMEGMFFTLLQSLSQLPRQLWLLPLLSIFSVLPRISMCAPLTK